MKKGNGQLLHGAVRFLFLFIAFLAIPGFSVLYFEKIKAAVLYALILTTP